MRVVAGSAKGQRLNTLPGDNTRPTMDRIKESMFNMIQLYLRDAKALDLFGGSGALGIEALSRGAKECIFVDEHRGSVKVIEENLKKTGFKAKSQIISTDFRGALENLRGKDQPFDLIFLDPPYGKGFATEALEIIEKEELLAKEGLVIIEQDKNEPLEISEASYLLWKEKKYGNIMVRILKKTQISSLEV